MSTKKFNYDLAAKIPALGLEGIGLTFLAARDEVFPPRPAHLVCTLNF